MDDSADFIQGIPGQFQRQLYLFIGASHVAIHMDEVVTGAVLNYRPNPLKARASAVSFSATIAMISR